MGVALGSEGGQTALGITDILNRSILPERAEFARKGPSGNPAQIRGMRQGWGRSPVLARLEPMQRIADP
jgi:hypothetical protein